MSATAARTTTKTQSAAKTKVLPPARALARQAEVVGPKFVRLGGTQAHDQRPRFALPTEHRRSSAANQASTVSSSAPPENPVLSSAVVSGVQLLEALDNLPGSDPARGRARPTIDLHPWSFPDASTDARLNRGLDQSRHGVENIPPAIIQFAQLPQTQLVAPPLLPLHRPVGTAVTTHSLKRFDATSITTGGAPLPVAIRNPLARTFSIDLTPIRVHTGVYAQKITRTLSTRAFAYGNNIFLGSGEQPTDLRLMAHEVAHVVQQSHGATLQHFTVGSGDACEREAEHASAAALSGGSFTVAQQASPRPQGLGLGDLGISIPDPLGWLADKANMIPGFRMFTIVLGMNPINMSPVDRSAANILRALIEFLPGGGLITEALDNAGVFEKAGAFVEEQIASLGMTGAAIKAAVTSFIAGFDLMRLVTEPASVWADAERIFTEPIDRIISFAKGLVNGIIELIKDAILKPIAKLAEGTEGYNLLKGILGQDPITGEAVTPSAETLLGPLLNMIGLGDVWQKMQEAKAVPRAWAWFQTTMSQLFGFVSQIPDLFIAAFKSLTIEDIILVPKAFAKLAGVFGGFLGKFVSWGVDAMFKLLEIVFDVVNPKAFGYVKQTASALKSILQNPLPFVGNLVNAAKTGFVNFGKNFVNHLKKGLIDWLTGSLEGVYIPKALSLPEFGKLALSILGITWTQIRGKIVKALGPAGATIMAGLEALFDVVKALKDGGPAAAWDVIKDKLSGLKDTIVSGIISFVTEAVVTKAVPKLIAMFIPGAGFISAIISIWDIIKVFIEKISKIMQVVGAFLSSIVAIAAGNIGAAAAKVESVLGGILSLAISFFAGFVGLGKVSTKVREVINKVRATVDKAIDTAINFIITKAKKLFAYLFSGKKDAKPDKRTNAQMLRDLDSAIADGNKLVREAKKEEKIKTGLPKIQSKYKLTRFVLVVDKKTAALETIHLEAEINPRKDSGPSDLPIGKWKLAEGGLKAHETQILSSDKGVHLIGKHGNDVVLLEMEDEVKKMIASFNVGRRNLIAYYGAQVTSISEAISRIKPGRNPAEEVKREKRLAELNKNLAGSRETWEFWKSVNPTDREAAAAAMQHDSWRSKAGGGPRAPNELRKTRFMNNKVLEAAVMKTLAAKVTEIDEGLDKAPGKPLKITHQLGGNLGVGYEMDERMQAVRVTAPMSSVSLILRVQDEKARIYMVETGWPHP